MRPRLLLPAAALSFAAGWFLDSLWDPSTSATLALLSPPSAASSDSSSPAAVPNTPSPPAPRPAPVPTADTGAALLALYDPFAPAKSRARLQRALEGKTAPQLSALIRQLAALLHGKTTVPPDLAIVAQSVISRLLILDPADGVDFTLTFSRDHIGEGDKPTLAAIAKVLQQSPARAAEILARHGGSGIWERFNWLESLDNMDPAQSVPMMAAFDRAARIEIRGLNATGNLPEKWIKQDAPTAMSWALALPPGYSRRLIVRSMANAWGRLDPSAARTFLTNIPETTLPPGTLRNKLLQSAIR